MSEFKGTPGPWEVGREDRESEIGSVYCDNSLGSRVAIVFGKHQSFSVFTRDEERANARLIAAAPDLLEAQTMGIQLNTPDFLDWMAERLVNVYGESPHVDFVLSLKDRASAGRAAIAKALGETK